MEAVSLFCWRAKPLVFWLGGIAAFFMLQIGFLTAVTFWVLFYLPTWSMAKVYERFYADNSDMSFSRGRRQLAATRHNPNLVNSEQQIAPDLIRWGAAELPPSRLFTHFGVIGASGSGKSVTIKLFMIDQLPKLQKMHNSRAMIYDSKGDMLEFLYGLNLGIDIVPMNPFDKRSSKWDMAKDIVTVAQAIEFSQILIPEVKEEKNPFFTKATQLLLSAAIQALNENYPEKWTFRDLIYGLTNAEFREKLLNSTPQSKETYNKLLAGDRTSVRDVEATLLSKLQPFAPIAAIWDRTGDKKGISLRDWANKGHSILVLGHDETASKTTNLVNQALVKFSSTYILSKSDVDHVEPSKRPRTIFVFDEFREAEKLPGLRELLLRGRSKGWCGVLGFQDFGGLQAVYGKEEAEEIVGQIEQKAFLRVRSAAAARWASDQIGEAEIYETTYSETWGYKNHSVSANRQRQNYRQVLPSQLQSIPEPDISREVTGYYFSIDNAVYRHTYELDWALNVINEGDSPEPAFVPRNDEEQKLRDWTRVEEDKIFKKPKPDLGDFDVNNF